MDKTCSPSMRGILRSQINRRKGSAFSSESARVPEEAVKKGLLREDLYYRLNVFHIHLPPLRDRKEDIMPIAESLISLLNSKHDCKVTGISQEVQDVFRAFNWPGNVRELRNALERAVILAGQGNIERKHLPNTFTSPIAETPVIDGDSVMA